MTTSQFMGILLAIALIYNSVVLFVYFKSDIKGFFGKKANKNSADGPEMTGPAPNSGKKVLMGATRYDDTAYNFSKFGTGDTEGVRDQGSSSDKIITSKNGGGSSNAGTKIGPGGDNSFSTRDIEKAMGDLNHAIENRVQTSELDTDLFGQLSKNGSVKIAVTKGEKQLEREMMALENTIVI